MAPPRRPGSPLADAVTAAVAGLLAGTQLWRVGTVTAVVTGPPATVTVTIRGQSIAGVHYLTSYTPTVADNVALLGGGNQIFVLGKLSV
jgi:hypothetical protein